MAGHNSNESVPFTPTDIATDAELQAYVAESLPDASAATLSYMLSVVYPPVFDGTYGYWSEFGRLAQIEGDFFFSCSTNFLATAFKNETYNYIFAYPPGYHAEDVPYTFFNGDTTTIDDGLPVNPTLARELQDYLMSFAKTSNPNYVGSTQTFPEYGSEGSVLEFTYYGLTTGIDDMKNARCTWLQQSLAAGLLT
jgi:carboxylesterase type B